MKTSRRTRIVVGTLLIAVTTSCGGSESAVRGPGPTTQGPPTVDQTTASPEAPASGSGRHKFLNTTCTDNSDGNFTSKITDLETIHSIFPPGGAAGYEIKPHGYFLIKGERVAVYAPIDM